MTENPNTTPITVTHIISGDLWAGAEVQVYNLCKALHASADVAVTAVVFNPGILRDKLIDLGVPLTLVDERTNGPLAIAKSIANHCKARNTDIVHTHGLKENVLGIIGKEMARVRYSVRTVHGNPEHRLSWQKPHKWLVNRLDNWLGRTRQQAIVAVSSQLTQLLEPMFPGKVYKIFNFVDAPELRKKWLPKPARTSSQIRVGIVGRLVPVKRVDVFIRTIHLLLQQGIDCKGIILGDGPLRANLQTLAADLAIEDRIEFRGFVDPVAKEMMTLDALLMPSDHEGLPMTLLEALALEVPVIAHNTGGIPEILNYGKAGWLIDQNEPAEYALAVKNTFTEHESSLANSNTYNNENLKYFDAKNNSKQYINLYIKSIIYAQTNVTIK
jgi:glycosyltransferase involved in cell wall biosynthesis